MNHPSWTLQTDPPAAAAPSRKRPRPVVYLAAPLTTYGTERYETAARQIFQRHPRSEILLPHALWSSNEHWRTTFRETLSWVSVLYLLADECGFVGKGVCDEVQFLHQPRRNGQLSHSYGFTAALLPSNVWRLFRNRDSDDWRRFARLWLPDDAFPVARGGDSHGAEGECHAIS